MHKISHCLVKFILAYNVNIHETKHFRQLVNYNLIKSQLRWTSHSITIQPQSTSRCRVSRSLAAYASFLTIVRWSKRCNKTIVKYVAVFSTYQKQTALSKTLNLVSRKLFQILSLEFFSCTRKPRRITFINSNRTNIESISCELFLRIRFHSYIFVCSSPSVPFLTTLYTRGAFRSGLCKFHTLSN